MFDWLWDWLEVMVPCRIVLILLTICLAIVAAVGGSIWLFLAVRHWALPA